jgi:hypothetical protein
VEVVEDFDGARYCHLVCRIEFRSRD